VLAALVNSEVNSDFTRGELTIRLQQPCFRQDIVRLRPSCKFSAGIAHIAKATGLTRQTIYRIKDDPAGSETALGRP